MNLWCNPSIFIFGCTSSVSTEDPRYSSSMPSCSILFNQSSSKHFTFSNFTRRFCPDGIFVKTGMIPIYSRVVHADSDPFARVVRTRKPVERRLCCPQRLFPGRVLLKDIDVHGTAAHVVGGRSLSPDLHIADIPAALQTGNRTLLVGREHEAPVDDAFTPPHRTTMSLQACMDTSGQHPVSMSNSVRTEITSRQLPPESQTVSSFV